MDPRTLPSGAYSGQAGISAPSISSTSTLGTHATPYQHGPSSQLHPHPAPPPPAPPSSTTAANPPDHTTVQQTKKRRRRRTKPGEAPESDDEPKRRVVTTACIACRKRKSKCDGHTPACAACSQVYGTACVYDPNSDHRRKGVYRSGTSNALENAVDGVGRDDGFGGPAGAGGAHAGGVGAAALGRVSELQAQENATLGVIVHALLNYPEHEVPRLVRQIRTCESLDEVAAEISRREQDELGEDGDEDDEDVEQDGVVTPSTPLTPSSGGRPLFESHLGVKMGELRLDDGSVRYIGGTSHLLFLDTKKEDSIEDDAEARPESSTISRRDQSETICSWTNVVRDPGLITHLLNLYFTWHYSYFTCLARTPFYRDFMHGWQPVSSKTEYCSPMLVNAMLALGCHFTSDPAAREDPADAATAGDHFFKEAKRLMLENDEHERPRIVTVQALALMSVREAGCGREAKGWVYSGMSFRMACDIGLHLDPATLAAGRGKPLDEEEEDARRITFWGCFLFDKCWSNYLGRLPQLPNRMITCPKYDVFPDEDSAIWTAYGDHGIAEDGKGQAARTRTVALKIAELAEISGDLMQAFYNPGEASDTVRQKGKQSELKKLSELEIRLESWRKSLGREMEAKEGALPSVFIMHMFFQLLFVHLFRPFLKYTAKTSPLPPTVSPRRLCTNAATTISRILRLYKRTYGLGQICNIAVYIIHTACTIHLLNLPDRDARRDIVHGVKHLEEMAESWPSARRTLSILSALAGQWKVTLPEDASAVLARCEVRFGRYSEGESPRLVPSTRQSPTLTTSRPAAQAKAGGLTWILPNTADPKARAASTEAEQQQQQHHHQQQALARQQSQVRARFASYNPTPSREVQQQQQRQQQHQTASKSRDSGASNGVPYLPGAQAVTASTPMSQADSTGFPDSAFTSPPNGRLSAAAAGYFGLGNADDMFGGVEQLLRDAGRSGTAKDWMANDQQQLAWGFGNWNGMDGGGVNDGGAGGDAGAGTDVVVGPLPIDAMPVDDAAWEGFQQQRRQYAQQQQYATTGSIDGYGSRQGLDGELDPTTMANIDGGWGQGWT